MKKRCNVTPQDNHRRSLAQPLRSNVHSLKTGDKVRCETCMVILEPGVYQYHSNSENHIGKFPKHKKSVKNITKGLLRKILKIICDICNSYHQSQKNKCEMVQVRNSYC